MNATTDAPTLVGPLIASGGVAPVGGSLMVNGALKVPGESAFVSTLRKFKLDLSASTTSEAFGNGVRPTISDGMKPTTSPRGDDLKRLPAVL